MNMVVLELLHNIALLLALSVAFDLLFDYFQPRSLWLKIIHGVLFGAIAVIGMMTPVRFAPGIVYDGRSVVLAAAGYMGGPIVAAVSAVIAAVYRFSLGGAGAFVGVLVVIESSALGAIVYALRHRNRRWETTPYLLAFGVVVHVLMLGIQLGLPDQAGIRVIRQFGIPIIVSYPLGQLLILRVFLQGLERRRNLDSLKAAEEWYRALFDNNHAPMFVIDPQEGRILDANGAAARFYGWSVKELEQMYVRDINTMSSEEIEAEMERARTAQLTRFEFRHRRKDGSIREVAVASGRVVLSGKDRLYSIIEDITDRKRRDRDLYLANYSIENSAIAIFRIDDTDGRIRYANKRACESLQYTKQQLLSLSVFDIDQGFNPESWRTHRKSLGQEGERTFESTHRRKDGTEFPVEITVSKMMYQDEPVSVSFAKDITERRRVQTELEQSLKEKSVLLQEVHHRVRNNLSVIVGLINLQINDIHRAYGIESTTDNSAESSLRRTTPIPKESSPTAHYLDPIAVIEKTRDRVMVMGLIHDMMYHTQDLTLIDFAAFLRQVCAHLHAQYGHDQVTLSIDPDQLKLEVTEAVPLGLIAGEAITNALKHAHPDGSPGVVTVSLKTSGADYELVVTDDGKGLSGPFDPEEAETLGFELMRSLAQQINGTLVIQSATGGGCVVRITGTPYPGWS